MWQVVPHNVLKGIFCVSRIRRWLMNTLRQRKAFHALALFLVFAVSQVYIQLNFAGPTGRVGEASGVPAQGGPLTGKLITTDNKPVVVNGVNLNAGGTLLSGATIEVPDGVGATIDLGPLGQLDLAPNTKVVLEFSDGQVRVRLVQGCAILRTKKGTDGQINTEQGTAAETDKNCTQDDNTQGDTNNKKRCVADVCFPLGASSPIVKQGAAAAAGAGAGGGGGIGAGTVGLIVGGVIGGTTGLVLALTDGDNPSPSTP